MIREMREKGMSISEIARQMRMGSNTVKKHLRLDKSLKQMGGEGNRGSILINGKS